MESTRTEAVKTALDDFLARFRKVAEEQEGKPELFQLNRQTRRAMGYTARHPLHNRLKRTVAARVEADRRIRG